jgi:hypothetical protein
MGFMHPHYLSAAAFQKLLTILPAWGCTRRWSQDWVHVVVEEAMVQVSLT